MLSNTEKQSLQKLLSRSKGTLQQLSQQYFSLFKQTLPLLHASTLLSQLLLSNKLQPQAHTIGLYLLLLSYNDCDAEQHPFVFTLLWVSQQGDAMQRQMVYDVLVRGSSHKYAGWMVEDIPAIVAREKELVEEEKEIRNLRHRVVERYRELEGDQGIRFDDDDCPDFLRLAPQFIPVSNSQLNWLSPGIISDVQWDNSADIDKKLQKSRKIFQNALKRSLQQQERVELLNSIDTDPYCPLHIGFNVKDLNDLILHNSYIAASIVIKLSKYPIFQQYLEQFLNLPTSVPLLDTIGRIIKQIRVPQSYVSFFCCHHMKKMIKNRVQNYHALVYTMSAFLSCMIENQIVSPFEIAPELNGFMKQFGNIMDFGHFRKMMEKQGDYA